MLDRSLRSLTLYGYDHGSWTMLRTVKNYTRRGSRQLTNVHGLLDH